eukprot:82723_1
MDTDQVKRSDDAMTQSLMLDTKLGQSRKVFCVNNLKQITYFKNLLSGRWKHEDDISISSQELNFAITEIECILFYKKNRTTSNVITICITNEPWDIDPVIRKRLPCRIYVKLPDNEARKDLLKMYIDALPIHTTLLDSDYETLAEKTNGFTCDEIYCIVQDTHHHAEAFESLSFVDIITTADNTKASVTKEDIQRLHDWTQYFGCS